MINKSSLIKILVCSGIALAQSTMSFAARGLDLDRHCKLTYGEDSAIISQSNDAYGWKCEKSTPHGLRIYDIDMNQACVQQYGHGNLAVNDTGGQYDWECCYPRHGHAGLTCE
jgi:hypothetical protein